MIHNEDSIRNNETMNHLETLDTKKIDFNFGFLGLHKDEMMDILFDLTMTLQETETEINWDRDNKSQLDISGHILNIDPYEHETFISFPSRTQLIERLLKMGYKKENFWISDIETS